MIYLSKQLGTWTFVHQLIVFYGQFFYFLKGACSLQTNKGHEKYSKSKQTNVKPCRLVFSWDETDRTHKLCSFQQVLNVKLKSGFHVNITLLLIFIVDLSQKSLFPWKFKCFVFTCYSLSSTHTTAICMYCLFSVLFLKGKWCPSDT